MLKVGVIGASGRMGSETCRAIEAAEDLDLVARIERGDDLDRLLAGGAEVAVEFTLPDSVKQNSLWCLQNGIHTVVGATGLNDPDIGELRSAAEASGASALVAPNFAIGAVLMMHFAAAAAPHFRRAEVIERHHEGKRDAPSGTALRTVASMNERRSDGWETDAAGDPSRGLDVDGVRIHSLRTPGSVAHQEVILGAPGETLTIRHDSLDRASFMPGVLLAVRGVSQLDGVVVGLEGLLDL